jgi:hypothetical protein
MATARAINRFCGRPSTSGARAGALEAVRQPELRQGAIYGCVSMGQIGGSYAPYDTAPRFFAAGDHRAWRRRQWDLRRLVVIGPPALQRSAQPLAVSC